MYTGSGHGGILDEIAKGAHMNELEKLLNEPECLKPTVTESPKQKEKPTAAANKANILIAQEKAIAAASVGGAAFRSAAAFLAASLEVKGYHK